MSAPVANFKFLANGLSVQFTDRSSGIITGWSWDFGYEDNTSTEVTSTVQNPEITFPADGVYKVTLTVSNANGQSTISFDLVITTAPTLGFTIREMVEYDLPVGIALDSAGFNTGIQRWFLFLQGAANVADADVFTESKWPGLYRVLIAKALIYELIQKAGIASMSAYVAAAESSNQLASTTVDGTIQVADYTIALDQSYPITVNNIIANGVAMGPSGVLPNLTALLAYLNGLGVGQFAVSGGNLVSLGNIDILTTFNYTASDGGYNGAFAQSNSRVVPITTDNPASSVGAAGSKGPLKHMEAGPSKAQWYDSSQYWLNIFRTPDKNGSGGGLITAVATDLCMYAGRLTVQLPMCPKKNTSITAPFIGKRCGNWAVIQGPPPVSNGAATDWFWRFYYV